MLGHVEAPQYIVCLEKAVVAFFNHSFLLIGCPSQLKDLTAGGWGFSTYNQSCAPDMAILRISVLPNTKT